MARIPIALQLYSVRNDCATDLASVLDSVAKMGYEGVEFAGYHGHGAEDVRKMLDNSGLVCVGTHTHINDVMDDAFDATADFNKAIGSTRIVIPALPPQYRESLDAWMKTAEFFNRLVEKADANGVRIGYHNHAVEFQQVDGKYPWDVFFSNVSDRVIMQVDSGNARTAGVDVAPFIERYPDRAETIHLKDWSDENEDCLVGEGKVNWEQIFQLAETCGGTQWYIVEQERYPREPMECVKVCLENLKKMGK